MSDELGMPTARIYNWICVTSSHAEVRLPCRRLCVMWGGTGSFPRKDCWEIYPLPLRQASGSYSLASSSPALPRSA